MITFAFILKCKCDRGIFTFFIILIVRKLNFIFDKSMKNKIHLILRYFQLIFTLIRTQYVWRPKNLQFFLWWNSKLGFLPIGRSGCGDHKNLRLIGDKYDSRQKDGKLGRGRGSNGRSPRSYQNGSLVIAESGKDDPRGLSMLFKLFQRGQPPRKIGSPKEINIFISHSRWILQN